MVLNARSMSFKWCLVAAVAILPAAGCGRKSADQSLEDALKSSGKSRETVYPFAGTVRIDGLPPKLASNQKLIVMLNDPSKPDTPVSDRKQVTVNAEGKYEFQTYSPGDGIPAGHYVLTFAVFQRHGKAGFEGPDLLNNLYNDPDKNAANPELVVDHEAPGSTQYDFDLKIAGKEPGTPGPHSLTGLHEEYFKSSKKR